MARNTKIITVDEVIRLAFNRSVDSKLFEGFILPAQRQYLFNFLGEDFYEEILDQVENDTLTADNSELLEDYLKPMLANFIAYDALPEVHFKITNSGVTTNLPDTAEVASTAGFKIARESKLRAAEMWKKDTKTFIKEEQEDDSSKYPDFKNTSSGTSKYGIIVY